jgi:cephalosporin hydroxylase
LKLIVDTDARALIVDNEGERAELPLYSSDAFRILSHHWLRVGWSVGHWQTFAWHGLQMLQLPEDVLRLQEAILRLSPDVIVETGVFSGGSSAFFASLCRIMGKGRVVSIEARLRPEVRQAIAAHPLSSYIDLIEGNSVAPAVVDAVKARIAPGQGVFIFLDSDHGRQHVLAELEAYAPLVTVGSFIVAADGVMRVLTDVPNGSAEWCTDNPAAAAREFLVRHPTEFELAPPAPAHPQGFAPGLTYFQDGWLRRIAKQRR